MYKIYQFKNGYYYPFCEFKRRESAISYFNYIRFGNTKYILKDDEDDIIIVKNFH